MCMIFFIDADGVVRRTAMEIGTLADIVRRLHKCARDYAAHHGCVSRMKFLNNGFIDEHGDCVAVEVSV